MRPPHSIIDEQFCLFFAWVRVTSSFALQIHNDEVNGNMQHIKARILALILILLGSALIYINWRQLWTEGTYSMKLAAFGPVVGVGGLFLLLFPSRAGKPNTTAEKITVLLVFAIGLVAGLVNWYLMDPGFFGM